MHRDAVRRLILLGIIGTFAAARGGAASSAESFSPHFASFSSGKVYMREGPGYAHRVLWVYQRRGLPVEVLAAFDVWRRVEDPHGTTGWVHSSMVSDKRTIVVVGAQAAPVREDSFAGSHILALAQPGAIGKLEACAAADCEISVSGIDGWIDKKNIWGVSARDVFH